ncbi:MAG TPA: hypothetical protein VFK38_06865 [Candidatus Limnocylindrales bacterium]|nr:hypothetical protein [Candidatus Limnocylindrales bacterium]
MFDPMSTESPQEITLYTDSHLVHGTLRTRQRRLSDVLNETDATFLVLEEVRFEEFGSRALIERAPYAHINLDTVLFGVADQAIEAMPEMRTIKVPEHALISVPPFRITGRIHLLPERDLRQALAELDGRFLPVTEAIFWSDRLNEARTQSPMLAFNHARAQILAPYQERDVWAGVSGGPTAAAAGSEGASEHASAVDPVGGWPAADLERGGQAQQSSDSPGAGDPWRDLPGSSG